MTKVQQRSNPLEEHNKHLPDAQVSAANKESEQRVAQIRELNDQLRSGGRGGMVVLTNGIGALGLPAVNRIFAAVACFSDFTADNDPWGEHDCAALTWDGKHVIWKIVYYDRGRRFRSPDPADPKVTVRVLTVMLAEEY